MSAGDPREAFREAIEGAGLVPPEAIDPDGKLHRFSSNGKRGDDAGWYVLHGDGIPAGCFGDWRTDSSQTWRADLGRALTSAEEAAHQRRVDAMRRAREAEETRLRAQAAKKARALWAAATPLREPDPHPYLIAKRVAAVPTLREIHAGKMPEILGYQPHSRGATLAGRILVVPLRVGGELSMVELIDESGRKSFLRGGAVAGGHWAPQELLDGDRVGLTLLIGEGVATVLSAREASGYPVIAALSSGNLLQVAREMRKRYPKALLGVLGELGNGQKDAEEAARATGSALILPGFGEDRPEGATDCNDMHGHRGLGAVAECIAAQVATHAAQERGDAGRESQNEDGADTKTEPGLTDLGNAHRFAQEHRENIRFCWPWSRWLVWNGRFWSRDETGEIHRLAEATVRAMYKEAAESSSKEQRERLAGWAVKCESHERRLKMLASAQAIASIPILPADMDRDPWLLNVRNGTIDLRTGALRPHAREDLITRGINVNYDPAAVYPTWTHFISELFAGDAETIAFVQRALGYSVTGAVSEDVFFILHGAGSNGKTTFNNCVHDLLDGYAGRVPAELLMIRQGERHPTELATLFRKRFVSCSETGDGRRLAEDRVKSFTSSDPITCRRMREDFWEFQPTHKLWVATNHKPQIRGTDHGIWRRVRLLPFIITFHEPETDRKPQKDPTLPERLRAERSGILRWAVEGALAWQREGLKTPKAVRDATEAYRAEMDVLAGFLEECCVFDEHAEAGASDLYRAYTCWCDNSDECAESQTSFGMRLRERGLTSHKRHGRKAWRGIRLKSGDSWDSEDHFSGFSRAKKSQGGKPGNGSQPSQPSPDPADGERF
jgi:putative DNA primase/helicase